ncbi:MAG: IS3 family transposase [Candidatus Binatia bacterium]
MAGPAGVRAGARGHRPHGDDSRDSRRVGWPVRCAACPRGAAGPRPRRRPQARGAVDDGRRAPRASSPRWVRTTTPEPTPPAIPDLVHGEFDAPAPDTLWVVDITYLRTWEGWLYLATVIDVFSRRVIGFALADHMRASLVCDALRLAVAMRGRNVESVIFHSDRASQYTSAEFRALAERHGVKQSMGKTGVCWDNALAESFFATYKLELIEPRSWPTRARTRTATVHWIEAVYNRQRRHSAIDMLSPVDYEDRYWNRPRSTPKTGQ